MFDKHYPPPHHHHHHHHHISTKVGLDKDIVLCRKRHFAQVGGFGEMQMKRPPAPPFPIDHLLLEA